MGKGGQWGGKVERGGREGGRESIKGKKDRDRKRGEWSERASGRETNAEDDAEDDNISCYIRNKTEVVYLCNKKRHDAGSNKVQRVCNATTYVCRKTGHSNVMSRVYLASR